MAGTSKTLRQKVRVPLVPQWNNRDFYSEDNNMDSYFYNLIVDIRKDPISNESIPYAFKRPGVANIWDWSTTLTEDTDSGKLIQGMWVFKGYIYFVYDNQLYKSPTDDLETPILVYSFKTNDIFTATTTKLWQSFGNDFEIDFNYSGLEVFNDGIVVLYITNGLEDVYINSDSSYTELPTGYNQWTASTYLKPGDKIIPTAYANQNYWYMVIGEAGITAITGASEPTWPTSIGSTVTNGDVTFICMSEIDPAVVAQKYTNRTYAVGDLVVPSTESGYFYKCTTAGTASAEPGSWTQIKGDTSTATGGVVFECMGNYGGKPGLAIPHVAYLDTFIIMVSYKSSDIYHSDPSSLYSWNPLNFISADSFTTPIKAFTRYNNYILAFSETDGELFYNNANAEGSTLSRHESFLLQVGCFSQKTIISTETICIWIASSTNGGKSVWLLDGFEPKEVSTSWVNKMVEYEYNAAYYTISAMSLRVAGHFLILFKLSTTASLVFDVNMGMWYTWGSYGSALPENGFAYPTIWNTWAWDYFAVDQADKSLYLMSADHVSLSTMYTFRYTDYINDVEYPIFTEIRTHLIDFGNNNRKFGHSLDIIASKYNVSRADFYESHYGNITVFWTDDDYESLDLVNLIIDPVPAHTVSLEHRPRVAPIGNFRRRSFILQHTDPLPVRLEALEITYTQGSQ